MGTTHIPKRGVGALTPPTSPGVSKWARHPPKRKPAGVGTAPSPVASWAAGPIRDAPAVPVESARAWARHRNKADTAIDVRGRRPRRPIVGECISFIFDGGTEARARARRRGEHRLARIEARARRPHRPVVGAVIGVVVDDEAETRARARHRGVGTGERGRRPRPDRACRGRLCDQDAGSEYGDTYKHMDQTADGIGLVVLVSCVWSVSRVGAKATRRRVAVNDNVFDNGVHCNGYNTTSGNKRT